MKLSNYWLILILFLITNFNNKANCQNRMTESELENINGSGKPKAKVFKYDPNTNEFNGISFFKWNKNRPVDADSLDDIENTLKIESIANRINQNTQIKESIDRGMFSKDGKYYVSVDYPAGYVNKIQFFNSNGILLNEYKIRKTFKCAYDFNSSGNIFMLWGSVSGEFYFFTPTGKLIRNGDFNLFTKDPGTSYWKNEIGKTGKIWALINNSTFIFDERGALLDKIPAVDFAAIYENRNNILYVRDNTIYLYNYATHLIEYISTYVDCVNINMYNSKLYLLINDKIRLEYEITL